MKFKFLLTLAFAAGASLSLMAQGYKDGVETIIFLCSFAVYTFI